jgi:hypothetical protein
MLLLPAPAETRSTSGLLFYEIEVSAAGSVTISGFDAQLAELARAEIRETARHAFQAAITVGSRQCYLDGAATRSDDGGVVLEGHLDGQPYAITDAGARTAAMFTKDDGPSLEQWARLVDSLDVMAQALRLRGAQPDAAGEFCGIVLSTAVVSVAACLASVAGGPVKTLIECGQAAGQVAGYVAHC